MVVVVWCGGAGVVVVCGTRSRGGSQASKTDDTHADDSSSVEFLRRDRSNSAQSLQPAENLLLLF